MRLERADIRLFFAASGCGKSYRMARALKGQRRVLIWDVMAEYDGQPISVRAALVQAVKGKRWKIAYRPDFRRGIKDEFDFFCRVAYARGDCAVVVEELNQVTTPGYSPPSWRNLTSRGRHRGLHIFAASQRPGSVDKDAIGNATEIHAGRLPYARDRAALEAQLGRESARKLADIPERQFIEWKAAA